MTNCLSPFSVSSVCTQDGNSGCGELVLQWEGTPRGALMGGMKHRVLRGGVLFTEVTAGPEALGQALVWLPEEQQEAGCLGQRA